jgi:hypothetical protein
MGGLGDKVVEIRIGGEGCIAWLQGRMKALGITSRAAPRETS